MTADASPLPPRGHRRLLILCILVVAAISLCGWLRLRVNSGLEPLLPENSAARKSVLFLRDSSFAARAVLWFQLTGNGGSEADLYAAADAVERQIDHSLIKRVVTPPREGDAVDEVMGLLDHAGELLGERDLQQIARTMEPDALAKRMRENYLQLVKPEGAFFLGVIRKDPLGVNMQVLGRLLALTNGMGYRVEVKNGHLMHPDGRQLIVVLETTQAATSMTYSQALVAHLNALAATAPPSMRIRAIAGQIHTDQNADVMQRDIARAGIFDAIGFGLLFLLVCRDWRVGAVFMLPVVTIAMAIGLCALVYPNLSTIVMGLCATMAGSAIDYGIFVYTAINAHADMRRVRKHLLISLLTTAGVFVAFIFSSVPAYRQLGWLTTVSLVLSVAAALYVLPVVIKPGGKILAMGRGPHLHVWGRRMVPVAGFVALLLVAGSFLARHVEFDPDVTRLDGVDTDVKQTEKDFQKTWSRTRGELAMLVVPAGTREAAEEANDKVYQRLAPQFAEGHFISLSSFWPSAATRSANKARWDAFWTPSRIETLRKNLATAGEPYGFATDAFDPFSRSLDHPPQGQQSREILASVEGQFVSQTNGRWQMLSFFEDTADNVAKVRAALADMPEAHIVSKRALGQAFAQSASSETRMLIGIAIAFIIVSLLSMTRSLAKSILIMLPAAVGVVAMLTTLTIMSLPISVVTVIAAVVIMGLCSDYGIFAVFSWDEDETILGQGMTAMHLSSATTLIGSASLIFANHPALYLVGVSMTSGLLAGYLTAFLVVPGIRYAIGRRRAIAI